MNLKNIQHRMHKEKIIGEKYLQVELKNKKKQQLNQNKKFKSLIN